CIVLFGVVLTACGSTSTPSTPTATTATPHAPVVTLKEWSVGLPAAQVSAGKYTYNIVNLGQAAHELLVFKSDLAPSAYPLKGIDIDEEGPGITKISDGDNIDPGGSQQRTVDLSQPGKYLFVCNLPAHFKQGMF